MAMNPEQAVRELLKMTRLAIRWSLWTAETLWLGVRLLVSLVTTLAIRLPGLFASRLTCPRGHAIDAFGVWVCAQCHAAYEGHIGRCRHCGSGAGYTECPTCHLAVRIPGG